MPTTRDIAGKVVSFSSYFGIKTTTTNLSSPQVGDEEARTIARPTGESRLHHMRCLDHRSGGGGGGGNTWAASPISMVRPSPVSRSLAAVDGN